MEGKRVTTFEVVIPAYEPSSNLVDYACELQEAGFSSLTIVDDGSSPDRAPIFEQLQQMGCQVLHHPENRGKGAALKTAFLALRERCTPQTGYITVDCDGQHAIADVRRMAQALREAPDTLVLGCRTFGEDTPSRSRMGNRATSLAVKWLYHIELEDTQTGLRAFSGAYLQDLCTLAGDRYEYELNMLLYAKGHNIPFTVVPIQTLYFDNNSGSHYRMVRDSLRILGHLLRGAFQYLLSSSLSAIVDVVLYGLLVKFLFLQVPLGARVLLAAVIARMISSVVNYFGNRCMPTVQNHTIRGTLWKYYTLWAIQLAASIAGTYALCEWLGMDDMLAKLLIDLLLALASYQVQVRWVFAAKENPKHPPTLPHWKAFGRLAKRVVRAYLGQPSVDPSKIPEGAAVYVVHHQNMKGPIQAVAALPGEPHVWALHVFLDSDACFRQYYNYTFTQRFGWAKPLAFATAWVLQWIIPPFIRSVGAVPVYRKSMALRETMRQSQELLAQGESLVICPDVDYSSDSGQMGEAYTGFLALEGAYCRRTGTHLPFVPVHCCEQNGSITLGEPVYCVPQEGEAPKQVRQRTAQLLIQRMNELAVASGDLQQLRSAPDSSQPSTVESA